MHHFAIDLDAPLQWLVQVLRLGPDTDDQQPGRFCFLVVWPSLVVYLFQLCEETLVSGMAKRPLPICAFKFVSSCVCAADSV